VVAKRTQRLHGGGIEPRKVRISRPKPRVIPRSTLLQGLAEEIVWEDSVAALYAGLLADAICEGNPAARSKFEHLLTLERREQHSLRPALLRRKAG
jgi:hypothetical protein